MLKGLLLALAITWPPRVEVSSGASCRVVYTPKVEGDCEAATERDPQLAYSWRACGYVEWAGRGPQGQDIEAELDVYRGDSRHKAMAECERFLKAYEKVRKVR